MQVEVIDSLGSDLTVVNSARVSFGKRKTQFDEPSDSKLLYYLASHKHYSPFRHIMLQFHIRCPEFVARQLYKHVVGIETTSTHPIKDHAWNEISGRYLSINEFYGPSQWRKQSKSNKQGSEGLVEPEVQEKATQLYKKTIQQIESCYLELQSMGIAKEQARIILPLSFMTECYWTASFQAIMNFIELRKAPDAQFEIQEIAKIIEKETEKYFPRAYHAWSRSNSST